MWWDVDPIIFGLGPLKFRWYGLLFAFAFISGLFVMHWIFGRENKPVSDIDSLLGYIVGGTIIGARLGHCLFYEPTFYLSHPIEILKVWQGGLASHGATLGIVIGVYLFSATRQGYNFLWLLDRIAIAVPPGAALVRLGNLFNSEILGKKANVPWSFVFARVDSFPRHPAQLYESIFYLGVFGIMLSAYRYKLGGFNNGFLVGLLLTLVYTGRFFLELFKEPQVDFEQNLLLNMGQLLSIPMVICGLCLMFYGRKECVAQSEDAVK